MASERKRQEVTSDFAEPWNPENEGDTLAGTYLGYHDIPTQRGAEGKKSFRSYRIRPDGSDVTYGVSGAMLNSKFSRIPKGTFVWVTFSGKVKTQNGSAKDFKVECEAGTKLLDAADDSDIPF